MVIKTGKTNIPNEMGKDGKVVKKRKKKGNKSLVKTVSQEENVVIIEVRGIKISRYLCTNFEHPYTCTGNKKNYF